MRREHQFLNDLLEFIRRIEQYTAEGKEIFRNSEMIQDAVIRNLELIGEVVGNRLSEQVKARESAIPWRDIGDFRNLLIHQYDEVNLDMVWHTIQTHLPPLKNAVLRLLATLSESDSE